MAARAGGIPATSADARHDVIDEASSLGLCDWNETHPFFSPTARSKEEERIYTEMDGSAPAAVRASQVEERRRFRGCLEK